MSVMVEMTKEDANNLDEVVRELGIGESFMTPAEAVRDLKDRLEQAEACSALAGIGIDAHAAVVKLSKETMGKLIAAEKEIERLQAALCIFASRANWKQDTKSFPVEWAGVGSTPWEIAAKAIGLNALTEG